LKKLFYLNQVKLIKVINPSYRDIRGFPVDENNKMKLRAVLNEIFEQNSQIIMIALTTPEGLPIILLSREETEVNEISDANITNRYSALVGASATLGDRTLSTMSEETVRLIHVQGESRDIAISVADKLSALVITKPSGSANLLAEKITNTLKTQV
jgi:predicted regulator of Ras-like GTPase activity (Roadblock/LC7/MglB family)